MSDYVFYIDENKLQVYDDDATSIASIDLNTDMDRAKLGNRLRVDKNYQYITLEGVVYKYDYTVPEVVWQYSIGDGLVGLAVNSSGDVFAGTETGWLYKIDSSGSLDWSYDTNYFCMVHVEARQDGGCIIALPGENEMYGISSSGSVDTTYDVSSRYPIEVNTDTLQSLGVDYNGNAYHVTNWASISKWDTDGDKVLDYQRIPVYNTNISFDADGVLYCGVEDPYAPNTAYIYDASGDVDYSDSNEFDYCTGTAIDTSGNWYISRRRKLDKYDNTNNNDWSRITVENEIVSIDCETGRISGGLFPITPEVTTTQANNVSGNQITLNAQTNDYSITGTVEGYFEYREKGSATWTQTTAQTVSPDSNFNETITGLTELTLYEYRAYLEYGTETLVGEIVDFSIDDFYYYDSSFETGDIFSHSDTRLFQSEIVLDVNSSQLDQEDFETNLGDWVNDVNNVSDWIRGSGSTPSGSTGPNSAYSNTYYIYVETSSGYSYNNGDTDIIEYDLGSNKNGHVDFYYHQYGADQGTISLEGWDGLSWNEIWSSSGDQGTTWIHETTPETDFSGYSKLRFKNVANGGYRGDVALDLVTIEESSLISTGTCILEPIPLSNITSKGTSIIDLLTTIENDGEVVIKTAINDSDITAPSTWTTETNESSIQSIDSGTDLTNKYLWVKLEFDLGTDDSSPTVEDIFTAINQLASLPPEINITNYTKSVISDEVGYQTSTVTFQSNQDLVEWEARADGTGHGTGTLVGSGTTETADTNITFDVDYDELTGGDKVYQINVYGKNSAGQWNDD